MLVDKQEGGHTNYYDVCSQCHRRWFNKQLSEGPPVTTMKLRVEEIKASFTRNKDKKSKILDFWN